MNRKVTFRTTLDFGCLGERDVEVTGIYTPGTPAVMYLRNGDPGYPEEPAEFEGESIKLVIDDKLVKHYGFSSNKLDFPASFIALLSDEVYESLNEQGVEEGETAALEWNEGDRPGDEDVKHG